MLEIDEVKQYIKVDFEDDDILILELMEIAQDYVDYMAGESYKLYEKKVRLAKLLLKKIINDMYENRKSTVSENVKNSNITNSILDSLSNCEE